MTLVHILDVPRAYPREAQAIHKCFLFLNSLCHIVARQISISLDSCEHIEGWWIKLGVSYLWLAAWANLESPSQKVSMRDSLLWIGLWAYWRKIVLTELIDMRRSSPVLETPFITQKVLNCLRVESSCISKWACMHSLSALWMWPAASDSCLRLPG